MEITLKHYQKDCGGKCRTSKKLIASLKGEKLVIKSTRLRWMIEHGCIVTKLYGIIPAIPRRCFEGFMQWVSDERRKGDINTRYTIIAEACKNIGNSAFGRTVMDKNKHKNHKFCDVYKYNILKNRWSFYDADEYEVDGQKIYSVSIKKKTIMQNMPIQIGCSVFDDSKLRMYQFYYDCIDKYIDRSDFQYLECDTDSAYMALTDDLENLIKPCMKEEFEQDKHNWFPRIDTKENKMYDKRKPGLFKIEFEGEGMVALCSKSYYVWSSNENNNKYSCKGCQKNLNNMKKEKYINCLFDMNFEKCKNRGFKIENKSIRTYEQEKIALTPIYAKGIVLKNGINIAPLNI